MEIMHKGEGFFSYGTEKQNLK